MTRDYAKSLCNRPYKSVTTEIQKEGASGFKTTLVLLTNVFNKSNAFCCETTILEVYPDHPWYNSFSHHPIDRMNFKEFENYDFSPISPEEYQRVYDMVASLVLFDF